MRCYRGGHKHKFEPRYDEIPREDVKSLKGNYASLDELKAFLVYKVYVKDICVWCGKEIKK